MGYDPNGLIMGRGGNLAKLLVGKGLRVSQEN